MIIYVPIVRILTSIRICPGETATVLSVLQFTLTRVTFGYQRVAVGTRTIVTVGTWSFDYIAYIEYIRMFISLLFSFEFLI